MLIRRVTLVLDVPTRDGETELHILTDLTRAELEGREVANVYRKRWTLEQTVSRPLGQEWFHFDTRDSSARISPNPA